MVWAGAWAGCDAPCDPAPPEDGPPPGAGCEAATWVKRSAAAAISPAAIEPNNRMLLSLPVPFAGTARRFKTIVPALSSLLWIESLQRRSIAASQMIELEGPQPASSANDGITIHPLTFSRQTKVAGEKRTRFPEGSARVGFALQMPGAHAPRCYRVAARARDTRAVAPSASGPSSLALLISAFHFGHALASA